MKRTSQRSVLASLRLLMASLLLAALVAQSSRAADPVKAHSAVKPAVRGEQWWQERHALINERLKKTPDCQVLFIGDSITHGWEGQPKVWEKYFGRYQPVNMGIGGDRTQHVLWRLAHGNLDLVKPKLAVLMIGTNNSNGNDNTAEEIGDGITAIVKLLREKQPQMKVLVLGIFPRGDKPSPQREKNAKASEIASRAADGKDVHYLDIGQKFLEADGTLAKEIMPDLLHLNEKSYTIWAEAIAPKMKELIGE